MYYWKENDTRKPLSTQGAVCDLTAEDSDSGLDEKDMKPIKQEFFSQVVDVPFLTEQQDIKPIKQEFFFPSRRCTLFDGTANCSSGKHFDRN